MTSSAPVQKTSSSSLPRVLTRQDSGTSPTSSTFPIRRSSSDAHSLITPTAPQRTDARIYGAIVAGHLEILAFVGSLLVTFRSNIFDIYSSFLVNDACS
jgi:hypothetical protein